MLRMYWPQAKEPSILPAGSGTWKLPPVKRTGKGADEGNNTHFCPHAIRFCMPQRILS